MGERWTGLPDDLPADPVRVSDFLIDLDDVDLPATLAVPEDCRGLVIFADGRRAGHVRPANLALAESFQRGGLATLAFDMLTDREAAAQVSHPDNDVLPHRLLAVARWAAGEALPRPAPIGYFGLGTGVPAVLTAAAEDPGLVAAVVARGARPDTADPNLRRIVAPTLFIAGQGESPGALELVSRLALPWLLERFHAGDPRKSCAAPGIAAPPVRVARPLRR